MHRQPSDLEREFIDYKTSMIMTSWTNCMFKSDSQNEGSRGTFRAASRGTFLAATSVFMEGVLKFAKGRAIMRPLMFPFMTLFLMLVPHACASMTSAQGSSQPFSNRIGIPARGSAQRGENQEFRAMSLRGGQEEGRVVKLRELAMLVSDQW